MWLIFTVFVTKVIIKLSRMVGSHGTALPGLVAEQLYPHILRRVTKSMPAGVVIVTGTNGKTTTAKAIRHLLEASGERVLANRSGSNFTRGIISSIIEHADWRGKIHYDTAVLEVDEAYTPRIANEVRPKLIVVLNVMRDQLDRYGEIDKTARTIGKSLQFAEGVVLNSDDPPVAALGNDVKNATYFGTSVKLQETLPSDAELHGNLTEKISKNEPDVILTTITPNNEFTSLELLIKNKKYIVTTQLEGIHNYVNVTAALSAVLRLKGELQDNILKAVSEIRPAFGRGERLMLDGVPVHLALVKNPAGFNQNLRSFITPDVGLVLFIINDRYADGRDVSWLWDVDLTPLSNSDGIKVISSGIRALDMALRLKYEDVSVTEVETSIRLALKQALAEVNVGKEVLILPTYTAMLEIRKELSKSVEMEEIWR